LTATASAIENREEKCISGEFYCMQGKSWEGLNLPDMRIKLSILRTGVKN
jgi:hypothetical protein